jgi:hypothetical protein
MRYQPFLLCGILLHAYHEILAFQPLPVTKNLQQQHSTSFKWPGSLFRQRDDTTASRRRCQQGQYTSLSAASSLSSSHRRRLSKDIVIIGGGLAGLSAASYFSQLDPDRHVTILDKSEVLEVST